MTNTQFEAMMIELRGIRRVLEAAAASDPETYARLNPPDPVPPPGDPAPAQAIVARRKRGGKTGQ